MNAREDAVWITDTIGQLQIENERLKAEVELWKDRCAAELKAHEATIEHYETAMSDMRCTP
jgi:hypothetical protein